MAITNATRVADFGSGIGTQGAVLQVDNSNNRLGVGTTNPQAMLQVGTAVSVYGNSGIVSATSFYGDGSGLTGTGATDFINSTQLRVIGVTTAVGGIEFGAAGVGGTIRANGDTTLAGVTTFSGNIRVPDDKKLQFGNIGGANGDLQLWHDAGQHSYIRDQGSGDLRIYGSAVDIRDNAGTASVARFTDNSVHLAGITTCGILTAYSDVAVGSAISMYASSGIVSATAFYGDGSQLEGVSASGGGSSLDITSCLFI